MAAPPWAGLLEKINRTSFTADQVKSMPFPHAGGFAEPGPGGCFPPGPAAELTQCEVHPWLGEQLRRLLAMPFDCILTPNFTYEVECALVPDFMDHPLRYLPPYCGGSSGGEGVYAPHLL